MSRTVTHHHKGGHELWHWPTAKEASESGLWNWKNFTVNEMACKGTGCVLICPQFMDQIQIIRIRTGVIMNVTSGYRSPRHNANVSHTGATEGPHPDAQAVDVSVGRTDAYEVTKAAMVAGFKGIGLKQHGSSRYIHLDRWYKRPDDKPTMWTYFAP